MSDIADFVLYEVFIAESLRDDYVNGDLSHEDALDLGFVDPLGAEQEGINDAWDRSVGHLTSVETDKQLELATCQLDLIVHAQTEPNQVVGEGLNAEALKNLSKETPTCNQCNQPMSPRKGRYGKFYFCGSGCEGQPTVSDKYWQSVKIKGGNNE